MAHQRTAETASTCGGLHHERSQKGYPGEDLEPNERHWRGIRAHEEEMLELRRVQI